LNRQSRRKLSILILPLKRNLHSAAIQNAGQYLNLNRRKNHWKQIFCARIAERNYQYLIWFNVKIANPL